jgi:hypothetical protein
MNGDITLTDPMDLGGVWQEPYSGTSVDAISLYDLPSYNDTGSMGSAIGNAVGGGPLSGASSSNEFDNALSSAYQNILGGLVTAGTVAAKSALGSAIGGANPGPSNSNTNLANKSLLQKATSLQQAFLGGLATDPKTGRTNWWIVSALVGSVVLIIAMLVRR